MYQSRKLNRFFTANFFFFFSWIISFTVHLFHITYSESHTPQGKLVLREPLKNCVSVTFEGHLPIFLSQWGFVIVTSALSPGHMLNIQEKTSPSMVKLPEFGPLSERPFTCCATQLVQSKNGCSETSSHASHRLYDKLQIVRNSTQNPSRWDVSLTIRCDPTVVLSVSFIRKVSKMIWWELSPCWLKPETPCSDIYVVDHDWFSHVLSRRTFQTS